VRVIHVVPTPFGAAGLYGGGERYPLELARGLARHIDCELLTFGPRAAAWREPGGLRVRVLRRFALLGGHPVHPVAPQLAWSLDGADVVHTHHLRSAPSRLATVAAAVAGRHRVTTDHGLGGGGWGGLLPALFERFLTVSQFSADTLGVPPERTRVIYGGADPVRFRPGRDAAGGRDGVLYVGRITPHKGVDRLLRALPQGAALTVAGSTGHDPRPPERDYPSLLHRLATGRRVRFIAPVAEDDLPALYRRAAVFVLPTVETTCYGGSVAVTELLGLSVLEAMASGTPVVASRTGGLPELVRDGETGFLVTPGDVPELRDRLDRVLGDPALARRMGSAARELVLDRFTWPATTQRCLSAYAELGTRVSRPTAEEHFGPAGPTG
jgi:glycosyltransferase involved in cell wall biosynthesis